MKGYVIDMKCVEDRWTPVGDCATGHVDVTVRIFTEGQSGLMGAVQAAKTLLRDRVLVELREHVCDENRGGGAPERLDDMVDTANNENSQEQARGTILLTEADMRRFMELVIRSFFNERLRPDTPSDIREMFYERIFLVSAAHGFLTLLSKLASDSFSSVMSAMTEQGYRAIIMAAADIQLRGRMGKEMDEDDKNLSRFLDEKGILQNVPDVPPSLLELLDMIGSRGEAPQAKEDEECDCPVCTLRRQIERSRMADTDAPCRYRVECQEHGWVGLSNAEYVEQMLNPDRAWWCPICGEKAVFDEDCAAESGDEREMV